MDRGVRYIKDIYSATDWKNAGSDVVKSFLLWKVALDNGIRISLLFV